MMQGVDCSSYSGPMDWPRVRDNGMEFALIRAGSGWGPASEHTDARFHENAYLAAETGLWLGAFHHAIALSVEDAHREASCFLEIVRGYRFAFPVAVDIEDRAMRGLPPPLLGDILRAWCGDLRAAGYYPMVRVSPSTFQLRVPREAVEGVDLWLMRPGQMPAVDRDYGIWQHAVGVLPGSYGPTGSNRATVNYPALMASEGLNGFSRTAKPAASSGSASALPGFRSQEPSSHEPSPFADEASPSRPAAPEPPGAGDADAASQAVAMLSRLAEIKELLDTLFPGWSAGLFGGETVSSPPPPRPAAPPEPPRGFWRRLGRWWRGHRARPRH